MSIAWTKLILYGIIIGIANSIPGVSGGTMAVVLNIYAPFISAISSIKSSFRKSARFLLPLVGGIASGIFLFSQIITYCLEHHAMTTNFFFMGLIAGSLPMLFGKTMQNGYKHSMLIPFLLSFAVIISTILLVPENTAELVTKVTMGSVPKLFLAGMVAAAAMIVPGISGSFMLLLMGMFESVYTAISSFNITILLVVGLGCIAGIMIGTKVIEKLLNKFPSHAYSGIFGLVLGSIIVIFPGFTLDLTGIFSIVMFVIGTFITLWFSSDKRDVISITRRKKK